VRNSKNHPWREALPGAGSIDPIASSRSAQFSAYLETLSRDERRLIEAAERAFVSKSSAPTGARYAAAQDHAEGMLGVKENEPAPYRGFVV
jgi:hypothetical protein